MAAHRRLVKSLEKMDRISDILPAAHDARRHTRPVSLGFSGFLLASILIFMVFPLTRNESLASAMERQEQDIIAEVAGQVITAEEIERPLASRIHELENEIYRLKKQRLDQMVAQVLLQKEAQRVGTTPQKLVDDSILSQGIELSQEELDRYYEENRSRWTDWKGSEEGLRQQMAAHLGQQKGYQKVMDYAMSLRDRYEVLVHLKQPQLPGVSVNTENAPALGPSSAPVTVVEFSDYQCPACRQNHEVVKAIRSIYSEKIRWVFKDYPLDAHKWSVKAAEGARCANEQGKFWNYQNVLFSSKEELTPELLMNYANEFGLRMDLFNRCLESGKYRAEVEQDLEEGRKAGVNMTPTFIINGKMIPGGPPLEEFKRIIDQELAKEKDTG